MARYKLNTRNNTLSGTDISFAVGCQAGRGLTTGTVVGVQTNWSSVPAFMALDPLHVACPKPNQAIQAWWFESRGSIFANPEARISYRCVEFNTTLSCAQRTTDWKTFRLGGITALQLHDAKCELFSCLYSRSRHV